MDMTEYNEHEVEREKKSIEKLKDKSRKIHDWLKSNEEKMGVQGKLVKSNITDNESASPHFSSVWIIRRVLQKFVDLNRFSTRRD